MQGGNGHQCIHSWHHYQSSSPREPSDNIHIPGRWFTNLRISQLPLRLRLGGKSPRLTIPLLSLPPLQLHYHHYQPPPYHPRIPSHFNIGTMKMDRMMVRTNPCACLDVQTTVLSNSPYSSKIWFLQNLVSFLDITIR